MSLLEFGNVALEVLDSKSPGGFLILANDSTDAEAGYDEWVEKKEDLDKYFSESNLSVE
jgi:hypothetical protein